MKSNSTLTWAVGFAALVLSLSVSAAPPVTSNIEYLRPDELGKAPDFTPGSAHGHVRQRLDYGQGYRYGHSVNGPLGDIIIWSPAPNQIHNSTPIMNPRQLHPPKTTKVIGPQLQYKPEYGKTSKPGYGQ